MCELELEYFFHRCGHKFSVLAQSAIDRCHYTGAGAICIYKLKCPQCIGDLDRKITHTGNSNKSKIPCRGEFDTEWFFDQSPGAYRNLSEKEIWYARHKFHEQVVSMKKACLERSRTHLEELQKSYANVADKDKWYIIDYESSSCSFFRAVKTDQVPQDQDTCPICWGQMIDSKEEPNSESCLGGGACMIPCGHCFGHDCIRSTLMDPRVRQCPLCRHTFHLKRSKPLNIGAEQDYAMMAMRNIVFSSKHDEITLEERHRRQLLIASPFLMLALCFGLFLFNFLLSEPSW